MSNNNITVIISLRNFRNHNTHRGRKSMLNPKSPDKTQHGIYLIANITEKNTSS
jgi:hypothetical protein